MHSSRRAGPGQPCCRSLLFMYVTDCAACIASPLPSCRQNGLDQPCCRPLRYPWCDGTPAARTETRSTLRPPSASSAATMSPASVEESSMAWTSVLQVSACCRLQHPQFSGQPRRPCSADTMPQMSAGAQPCAISLSVGCLSPRGHKAGLYGLTWAILASTCSIATACCGAFVPAQLLQWQMSMPCRHSALCAAGGHPAAARPAPHCAALQPGIQCCWGGSQLQHL